MVPGPTKSIAGARSIALPAVLIDELRQHLDSFAESGPEGLLSSVTGTAQCAGATSTAAQRGRRRRSGLYCHAGSTLMHRMGHGSIRAALNYRHATRERDRQIADRLSTIVTYVPLAAAPSDAD